MTLLSKTTGTELTTEKYLLSIPRMYFDTSVGIKKVLLEKSDLSEVILLRKRFYETHETNDKLLTFIIDGKIVLGNHGEVGIIKGEIPNVDKTFGKVLVSDDFLRITGIVSYETTRIY